MSKILDKYYELKSVDKDKLYLFKSGKFYIFVGEDCDYIRKYMVLKKVKFTNDVYKCGFPENVLEEYMSVFNNLKLNVTIIDSFKINNDNKYNKIKKYVNSLDIDNIKPVNATLELSKIKEMFNE